MRKITSLLAVLALALALTASFAFADDGSSGCGLGWKVVKDNSLISSYTRSMTNFTFSSTFGMTSGTSGCAKHSIVQKERESEHFAEANYNALMIEMAEGRGEHLDGFAAVLGCGDGTADAFSRMSQSKYEQLFPSREATPAQLLQNVRYQMIIDPVLSRACGLTTG